MCEQFGRIVVMYDWRQQSPMKCERRNLSKFYEFCQCSSIGEEEEQLEKRKQDDKSSQLMDSERVGVLILTVVLSVSSSSSMGLARLHKAATRKSEV